MCARFWAEKNYSHRHYPPVIIVPRSPFLLFALKNVVGYKNDTKCSKKNLNASRPSEHPPVRGENIKTFR